MFFLFSVVYLSLSPLLLLGCEQRPDPGKAVTFISQKNKESSNPVDSQEMLQKETLSLKNKSDNSISTEDSQDEVKKDTLKDPFAEEDFTISSTEMGSKANENTGLVTQTPTENSETNIQENVVANVQENIQDKKVATGLWPVQLIGILDEATPKRALLRKANGVEISVKAGTMLSDENLVVLAIGKGHVSLAKILPQGDVTSIQQIDLQPLY